MAQSILVVDNEAATTRRLQGALRPLGYDVDAAIGGRAALDRLGQRTYDMTVVDMAAREVNGLGVLDYALRHARCRAVILTSELTSVAEAVQAMREGAVDFITKPFALEALQAAIHKALGAAVGRPRSDLDAWRQQHAPDFIGDDPKTLELLGMLQRIASSDCDVLLSGASGTGKELVARCLHRASSRQSQPFIAINCAAIPRELMESEMFGHARGAFTGANERRRGKVEAAAGGTLFLDEIGEMDLGLQGKFLRVIQEREICPVGDNRTVRVDVRVVSATNQDLEALCRAKQFREDLLYRLNVVPLQLPQLRERPADVAPLAQHFVERANRRHSRRVAGIGPAALARLRTYSWPGNVRELQNLVERLVVLKDGDGPLQEADLPPHLLLQPSLLGAEPDILRLPEYGLNIDEAISRMEIRLTRDALARANQCTARAAELLGLKRTTLVQRLKKMRLNQAL